ncbi:hypothetical protein [Streptomyces sp. NPDC059781]|uniref:hypothetical protein n=1 Tax=unclassified Streptomyces TaxID=2593676 RepID=UPI003647B985
MADTGGGTRLITAVAPGTGSRTGTVTWWDREDGRWVAAGSARGPYIGIGIRSGRTAITRH